MLVYRVLKPKMTLNSSDGIYLSADTSAKTATVETTDGDITLDSAYFDEIKIRLLLVIFECKMLVETSKQQRQMAILASMISKEKLTFQVKMVIFL